MRFIPRSPEEGINVSKEHPLVEAGTLIVGIGLIFAVIAVTLIFLVEIAIYFIPAEKEVALFEDWMPTDIVVVAEGDERSQAVDAILKRLSRHYPDSPYTFRIAIDDSEFMNAMALPGGLIVLTAGLLDAVKTENELAFIIGHELGHFKNRDHMRALGRGVVLGILFVAISGSGAGSNYGASIADLALRGFSRSQEASADEFGLGIVHKEFNHVADSWRFFERIDEYDGDFLKLMSYLSTHPSPDNRVDALIMLAGKNGWSITGELTPVGW